MRRIASTWGQESSAAFCCGLIEARDRGGRRAKDRESLPQHFAAASLKLEAADGFPPVGTSGLPQHFAAASLKLMDSVLEAADGFVFRSILLRPH